MTLNLCAVEVAGRAVRYDREKRAALRLRILNKIGKVAIDDEEGDLLNRKISARKGTDHFIHGRQKFPRGKARFGKI